MSLLALTAVSACAADRDDRLLSPKLLRQLPVIACRKVPGKFTAAVVVLAGWAVLVGWVVLVGCTVLGATPLTQTLRESLVAESPRALHGSELQGSAQTVVVRGD
jgi:hypothetical protein